MMDPENAVYWHPKYGYIEILEKDSPLQGIGPRGTGPRKAKIRVLQKDVKGSDRGDIEKVDMLEIQERPTFPQSFELSSEDEAQRCERLLERWGQKEVESDGRNIILKNRENYRIYGNHLGLEDAFTGEQKEKATWNKPESEWDSYPDFHRQV